MANLSPKDFHLKQGRLRSDIPCLRSETPEEMMRVLVLAALGAAVCLADDGTCEVAACSGPTSYANQVAALLSDYDKSMRPKLALGCEGAREE